LWILAAVFLIGLLIVHLLVWELDCDDLLLITPISSNSSSINSEQLEEINGDAFLLTYEILSRENLQALNSNYDVTLKKTNYTYHYLLGYKMVNGSFFTEEDQKRKQRAAVLNKAAAYAMFGNLDVCGRKIVISQEEYIVAGVMEDRDDKMEEDGEKDVLLNIYIPASISEQNPASFMVQLNGDLTVEQVKSECKDLAVPESGYEYIHFGVLAALVKGALFIGIKLALIGIFLALLRKSYDEFRTSINHIRELNEDDYLRQIIRQNPKLVMKSVGLSAAMALAVMLIMNMSISFIGYCLLWNDSISLLKNGDSSIFGEIAASLKRDIYLSVFLLIGFSIDMILIFFTENSHCSRGKHILYS